MEHVASEDAECIQDSKHRTRRSAAGTRAQHKRAEARTIQRFLAGITSLQSHRGCQPSALGVALATALTQPQTQPPRVCKFMPPCRHHRQGKCTWGEACRFSHDESETWSANKCSLGEDWRVKHGDPISTPPARPPMQHQPEPVPGQVQGYRHPVGQSACDNADSNTIIRQVPVPQVQTVEKEVDVLQVQPLEKLVPVSQVSIQEVVVSIPKVVQQEVVRVLPVPPVQVRPPPTGHMHMKRYIFRRTSVTNDSGDDDDDHDDEDGLPTVEIIGYAHQPELIGLTGLVVAYDDSLDKYHVKLHCKLDAHPPLVIARKYLREVFDT